MSAARAFFCARIFDGDRWHDDAALLVRNGTCTAVVPADAVGNVPLIVLDGGFLAPGFVDLQVNGGGGVLLNDAPTLDAICTICRAHAGFGTTALLPTLITAASGTVSRALEAGAAAAEADVPGFLGLHIEGPHLALERKGAHDPALIRPMEDADLEALVAARASLPNLLVTVAAEAVGREQIARLVAAGVRVSLGHTDAPAAEILAAVDAGATMVTHLFNAMSQLGNREPGTVGAALADGRLHAGLIADGIHVHPTSMGIALRAKQGPGHVFLVTDAMSPAGTDETRFLLDGRIVHRAGGALRLADGTLAGADLSMLGAVRFMHETIGLSLEEALRMASLYPAEALGALRYGHLRPGARADFIHLREALTISSVWIGGQEARLA